MSWLLRGIKMYQEGEKEIQKTGSIPQESEKTRKKKKAHENEKHS